MKRFRFVKPVRWVASLLLLTTVVALSGCTTVEPDNLSARPWNSPEGWEGGLPSSMFEGR